MATVRLTAASPDTDKFIGELGTIFPKAVVKTTVKALNRIGEYDTKKMRANPGSLKIKNKGLLASFKWNASDKGTGKLEDVRLKEWTRADMFKIFETGGTISPRKSDYLTVIPPSGRGASGKRKFSKQKLKEMVAAGDAFFKRFGRGLAIMRNVGGLTKSGKARKGSRVEVLAWLVPQVREKKRLNFYKNFESNAPVHARILEEEQNNAIEQMTKSKSK